MVICRLGSTVTVTVRIAVSETNAMLTVSETYGNYKGWIVYE